MMNERDGLVDRNYYNKNGSVLHYKKLPFILLSTNGQKCLKFLTSNMGWSLLYSKKSYLATAWQTDRLKWEKTEADTN